MKTLVERISAGLYALLIGSTFIWMTLGFSRWSLLFQLLRLWPLLIIIIGIEIIFSQTRLYFLRIISPLLVMFSVLGMIYFSQAGDLFHPRKIEILKAGKNLTVENRATDLDLNFTSGKLKIEDGDRDLIDADMRIFAGVKPDIESKRFEKEDSFKIASDPFESYVSSPWDNDHWWNVSIGKSISSRINVKTDFSINEFDLADLQVSEFNLDSYLSTNKIVLGHETKKANITSTGSKISILIPKESGIKISLNKFLITDNLKDVGLDRSFRDLVSSNYDNSSSKIDLKLDLKFSELEIKSY